MNHNSNSDNTNTNFATSSPKISIEQTEYVQTDTTQPNNISLTKANNELELSAFILDDTQPWQVHNCKIVSKRCDKQGTMPFLYHYDRLPDEIKHTHPLQGKLLAHFNTEMTATEACQLIGITTDNISQPWFVKIMGSVVIYHEPMQLALKLNWSNTNKQFDSIYCEQKNTAIKQAMESWQFINSVDVLLKKTTHIFTVYDEHAANVEDAKYMSSQSASYERMPANFAICVTEAINNEVDKLTWIDKAIQERAL